MTAQVQRVQVWPKPVQRDEPARVCSVYEHLARRCTCYPRQEAGDDDR